MNSFWEDPSIDDLEEKRIKVRNLMQYLKGKGRNKYVVDIMDDITDSDFTVEDTYIDIRTYREKVIDYLAEHSERAVIQKIHNLEQITDEDLKELEDILWNELGTQEEYQETAKTSNLAVFIRSLIGLSQEAVNEKFGEYLSGNQFSAQQQEFIKTIINYVRENGDIELADMVNTEPFSNFDINALFGTDVQVIVKIVRTLHDSVEVAA